MPARCATRTSFTAVQPRAWIRARCTWRGATEGTGSFTSRLLPPPAAGSQELDASLLLEQPLENGIDRVLGNRNLRIDLT